MQTKIFFLFFICGIIHPKIEAINFLQNTIQFIKQQINDTRNNIQLQNGLNQNQFQKTVVIQQNNAEYTDFLINLNSSLSMGLNKIKNLQQQYQQLEDLGIVDFSSCVVDLNTKFLNIYNKFHEEGLNCKENGTENILNQIDDYSEDLNLTYSKLDNLQNDLQGCPQDSSGISCIQEVLTEVNNIAEDLPSVVRYNNIAVNLAGASRMVPDCLETVLHNSRLIVAQTVTVLTTCFNQ